MNLMPVVLANAIAKVLEGAAQLDDPSAFLTIHAEALRQFAVDVAEIKEAEKKTDSWLIENTRDMAHELERRLSRLEGRRSAPGVEPDARPDPEAAAV